MRGLTLAALALLLTGCGGGGRPSAGPATTTAPPLPTTRVSVTTQLAHPEDKLLCCVELPTIHGLGSAAADGAANATLAAIGRRYDPKRGRNLIIAAELAAYDGRYATVEVSGHDGDTAVDETFVFERATGRRLAPADFFRDLDGARRAIAAYGKQRVPEVVGDYGLLPGWERGLTVSATTPFVPRPEGFEVVFTLPTDRASEARVAVPWTGLTDYLALPASPGNANPVYRDGRPPSLRTKSQLKEMHETGLIRVEESQRYDSIDTWVLATRESTGEAVVFADDGTELTKTTLADACGQMSPETKRAFLMDCP